MPGLPLCVLQMSYDEVRVRLDIEDEGIVKRLLHSLACGKYKILVKTPAGNSINPSDHFAVNQSFSCKQLKIRVPMAWLDESHNPKRVEDDRTNAIEAAIVRIMKTRKQLRHQELIMQVVEHLRFFKPNPKIIKRRIETLIDRDYLERDDEDENLYRYVA